MERIAEALFEAYEQHYVKHPEKVLEQEYVN